MNKPMDEWFYEQNGEKVGPVSQDEMRWLAETDSIYADTLIWKKGLPDWAEAQYTEIGSYFETDGPPPLHVNNIAIWLLAFAPILGGMLQAFLVGVVHHDDEYALHQALLENDLWYIAIFLNIGLVFLDLRLLKKSGYNIKKIALWLILIPVYMYQRAQMTKQNIAYVVVWVICFILSFFL